VVRPNCGHLPGYVQVDLGFAPEFAGWGCALAFFIVGNLGRVAFDEEAVKPHTRRPLPVFVSMLDAGEHRDRQTPPYLVATVSRATSELFGWPTTAGITELYVAVWHRAACSHRWIVAERSAYGRTPGSAL
jgi:hypothetical protein